MVITSYRIVLCERFVVAAVFVVYFEQPSYTVSEAAGTLTVCLLHNIELGAGIAPGLTVQINIAEISAMRLGKTLSLGMCAMRANLSN